MIDPVAAWRQRLLDDPQIAQIIGDRVFAHAAPRGHELPLIIITPQASTVHYALSGPADIEHTLQTRIIDTDRELVHTVLDRAMLAASTWDRPPERTSVVESLSEDNELLGDGSEQMYYVTTLTHKLIVPA